MAIGMSFEGSENVLKLDVVMVLQLCDYIKNWTVDFIYSFGHATRHMGT